MTRKKSKAKALALAVTCAILAGGYSGFNPAHADELTIFLGGQKDLKFTGKNASSQDVTVDGKITIYDSDITLLLSNNLDSVYVTNGGITLKQLADNVQNITYDTTNQITNISGKANISGIGFNNGAVTNVNSITGDKFSVDANGAISAVGGRFKVDENNIKLGYLTINATNDGIKFMDTNRDNSFTIADVIDIKRTTKALGTGSTSYGNVTDTYTSIGGKLKVYDKRKEGNAPETSLDLVTINEGNQNQVSIDTVDGIVISHQGNTDYAAMNEEGVFAGGKDYDSAKAYMKNADGSLKAASGKFTVDADGALKAANNNFSVDKDGKLMSANGSQIGGVTIDGESLSNGTKSIKVSELASDHALVNDADKGNEKLYNDLVDVQAKAQGLDIRTAGISRDTTGTATTTIEGKLQVGSDGTVKINEGDDQQVIIDSNGIKVGTGSAYINNDGFKAGADGKNSLTTSGLTAKTIKAGTNNDAFTVDENGNMVAKGSLSTASGKFSVDADGAIKAANNSFSVDKDGNIAANGTLSVANGKFQIDASGVVTAGSVKMDNIDAADTSKGVTVGGVVLKDKTISAADDKFTVDADGALKAAGGNFSVDADGALKAANSNFSVDKDGKLMSANGSQIGGVTIDGEKLSNGTKSITVSELASDHALVNDADKGNEKLYNDLVDVQDKVQGLNTKTAGIERDTTGTAATTIEGKLKVSSDGTVKINEGDAQQVIIDSNGIKVGKNSSRMNDSYGFATTRGLYVGADSADSPTAAGSKFYVNGSDGSLKAAAGKFTIDENGNVVSKGSSKSKTLTAGTNGDEFVVDENGNVVSKGSLSAAGGKFSVGADGALKAANDKFNVDKDGNVVANGALGAANGAFSVDISGNVITSGSVRLNSGANSTQLTAGGVKFIKDGTTTTIEGETVTVSSSSGNKSFNLSDMADVGQNMTNLGNRIEAEETKRAQEVSRLDTAISNETTKREQEVSRLDTAISNETTKREQEVSRLDTAINDEKTKREQEVSRLDTAISNETTKREQEVSRLDTAINDEKTKREQDVSRLDTAINDEKTKREQDVADLNGRVDTVNSRVDNISNDFNTAINDEKTKREQEVSRLDGRVDTVNSRVDNISNDFNTAINDEKTKREQEVSRLDGRIDTVNTNLGDLNDLDGDLKARDEYTGNSSVVGGINAEAAVRKEEVTRLDTAIADEAAARQADVARLDGRISDVSSRINKVGAMAAAISSLKTMGYDPESPTEFSIGLGQYKGETGVALGFFHYPNKNFMINVSLSTSSGEIMGGIGATWRFGHKSPQKLLDEQREAQVKKEIAAAEAYKAARAARTKDAK